MATTYNHAQIGIVDASGNINVIYPITTGADVSITRTNTKLPTAATTAQALANAFGKLAFADSEISDSVTSTTKTWSSNKINTAITKLNSNCKKINTYVGKDGKIHFVNSGGADTVLNFNKTSNYRISYTVTLWGPDGLRGYCDGNLTISNGKISASNTGTGNVLFEVHSGGIQAYGANISFNSITVI